MKLDPDKILERAGEIYSMAKHTKSYIQSDQVKAAVYAICDELNKQMEPKSRFFARPNYDIYTYCELLPNGQIICHGVNGPSWQIGLHEYDLPAHNWEEIPDRPTLPLEAKL